MSGVDIPVEVFVTGYVVSNPTADDAAWRDAAYEIASDIGGRLADVATDSGHGKVTLRCRGIEVTS